jgi:hypothetical protein
VRWPEEQEILETQAAEAGGPGPGEPAPDGAAATDELEDEDSGAAGLAPGAPPAPSTILHPPSSFLHPLNVAALIMSLAALMPGWAEHFDDETGCYFFYHEEKVLQQFSAC